MTKGGRPRKGERERRIDHLHVRLTTRERAKPDADTRQLGMPVSRYVRRLISRRRPGERHKFVAKGPATITALSRIGNNLNQLTRHTNAKRDLAPVARRLDQVLSRLQTTIDSLLDWPS